MTSARAIEEARIITEVENRRERDHNCRSEKAQWHVMRRQETLQRFVSNCGLRQLEPRQFVRNRFEKCGRLTQCVEHEGEAEARNQKIQAREEAFAGPSTQLVLEKCVCFLLACRTLV